VEPEAISGDWRKDRRFGDFPVVRFTADHRWVDAGKARRRDFWRVWAEDAGEAERAISNWAEAISGGFPATAWWFLRWVNAGETRGAISGGLESVSGRFPVDFLCWTEILFIGNFM
jgi:hypothetical protein